MLAVGQAMTRSVISYNLLDGRSVEADLCSGQTAGLTDWPIERIAQTVEPNDAQRALLDKLKDATAQALDILNKCAALPYRV